MYEAAANLGTSHEKQLVEIAQVFGKDARDCGMIAEMVRQEVAQMRATIEAGDTGLRYEQTRADHLHDIIHELRSAITTSLQQFDELAELWGDEGKFWAARDRLRKALKGNPNA